jgi:hypothetical protein
MDVGYYVHDDDDDGDDDYDGYEHFDENHAY